MVALSHEHTSKNQECNQEDKANESHETQYTKNIMNIQSPQHYDELNGHDMATDDSTYSSSKDE